MKKVRASIAFLLAVLLFAPLLPGEEVPDLLGGNIPLMRRDIYPEYRTVALPPQKLALIRATTGEKIAYGASLGWFLAGATKDMLSTRATIARGGYEANPLLTTLGNRNSNAVTGFLAGEYAIGFILDRFLWQRGHRKEAAVLNFIFGSVSMGFAIHNRTVCKIGCSEIKNSRLLQ
jgi:hypothetical protein